MRTGSLSIQRHPYLAVGITFAAGWWLGTRWSRRADDPPTPPVRDLTDPRSAQPDSPPELPERVDPYLSIRAPEESFSPAEGLRGNDSDAPTFGSEGGGGVPTVT
jgi:hypothetical protein